VRHTPFARQRGERQRTGKAGALRLPSSEMPTVPGGQCAKILTRQRTLSFPVALFRKQPETACGPQKVCVFQGYPGGVFVQGQQVGLRRLEIARVDRESSFVDIGKASSNIRVLDQRPSLDGQLPQRFDRRPLARQGSEEVPVPLKVVRLDLNHPARVFREGVTLTTCVVHSGPAAKA
jgi:hypothetical protein